MNTKGKSRRSFLIQSAGTLNAAWIAAHYHDILSAQQYASKSEGGAPPKLAFFTAEQAAEIEAMADQIIPTDDTPGAREARVIYFIDRALATFASEERAALVEGLNDLQRKTRKRFGKTKRFSDLSSGQQTELLKGIEKGQFFELVRTM